MLWLQFSQLTVGGGIPIGCTSPYHQTLLLWLRPSDPAGASAGTADGDPAGRRRPGATPSPGLEDPPRRPEVPQRRPEHQRSGRRRQQGQPRYELTAARRDDLSVLKDDEVSSGEKLSSAGRLVLIILRVTRVGLVALPFLATGGSTEPTAVSCGELYSVAN